MPRIARVVIPGLPHHITQRGNRSMDTFFCDNDYATYLALLAESCGRLGVEVWAYCLMPNHVHLVAVPESEDGLRCAIGDDWRAFLAEGLGKAHGKGYDALYRRNESTGRPLGPKRFVAMLEKALGRVLQPRKRGRKPKAKGTY